MRKLTQMEVDQFRRVGYLKLPFKVNEELIDDSEKILNKFIKSQSPPFKKDHNGNIVKLFNLFDRSKTFQKTYSSNEIILPLKSLLGENILFLKNRHNHASVISRKSNEKRFHRDILQWSRPTVSILIYTQDSSVENGTTELIPSSQYFPFTPTNPNDLPNHAGTWMDSFEIYNGLEKQAIPIIAKRGEVLVMDSLVFHTPTLNTTNELRYAITGTYHAVDELNPILNTETILISGKHTYCGNEYNWEKT